MRTATPTSIAPTDGRPLPANRIVTTLSSDLLVIGAGATGLGVAWDATLRGLSVTVVEQGDLGQGTSGRYHGLLHSGARYVVSDPASAADCARENEVVRRLVPHAVEPTGGYFLSTDDDPPDYVDRWLAGCRGAGVAVEELDPAQVMRQEPLVTPRLARAFAVSDAALDSFELLHALARGVRASRGSVLLRHRVTGLVPHGGGMLARIVSLRDEVALQLAAPWVVNAAGPFVGVVAAMAGVHLPLALGKGTMVAMTSRLTQTVLNRCKPPHDGDIIVPVGTVCVLGTTDVPVRAPTDLTIEPWEIDLLIREGQALIPTLRRHRPLRAWAGVRALYRPADDRAPTRDLPRAHVLIDHAPEGLPGFLTILGGKLTTFRRMAQDIVDRVSERPCTTAITPLPAEERRFYRLGESLRRPPPTQSRPERLVCECEGVTASQVEAALAESGSDDLDDLRRDLRLGMGPCQGAFCTYRAAAAVAATLPDVPLDGGLSAFFRERWRGIRPLAWGRGLRQADILRRIQIEALGADPVDEVVR